MNIKIRKCMISDAKRIHDLSRDILGFEYPVEAFEENIRKLMGKSSNIIYVAEYNDRVLGFAHACDFEILYGPYLKVLRAIAVDPEYRRCGAASALLDAVEKWAKDAGAEGLRIYSGANRLEAVAFYKSRGYEFIKTETEYRKTL